ncbi:MFS transporter [Planctomycetota bacterium]|nr:MFS transporter [Planctomycetota bacterium]
MSVNRAKIAKRERNPLWRNGSFTLMWTSVAASGFGDRMMMLAALVLLGGFVQGAEQVSIQASINFFFFLPYVLLSVAGGWLADHLPRKWLMLACDEFRGLLLFLGFLLVYNATGVGAVPESYHWQVLGILFLVGVFAAIFNPTRNAIVPEVVPLKQLQSANAIILSIAVIASMIGQVVGGKIINPDQASTVRLGLLIGAGFYIISGSFFAFLRIKQTSIAGLEKVQPKPRSYKQAVTYIKGHGRIVRLILLNMLIWAGAMVVYNAVLSLTKLNFGFIEAGMSDQERLFRFTVLTAGVGFGMLAGACVMAWIRTRRESDVVLMFGLMMTGVFIMFLAYSKFFYLSLALAFGVGVFGNMAIVSIATMLQSLSPNYMRGRVMGLNAMMNTLTNVIVNFIIWQTPNADNAIIISLYPLGALLALLGLWGGWRILKQGMLKDTATNVSLHLLRLWLLVWYRLEWEGRQNVPSKGPVILASNHTIAIDPFLIQGASPRFVRWVMLTEFRFKLLWPIWKMANPISLKLDGKDTTPIRAMVNAVNEGEVLGLFPEGGLQRDARELQPFKPGIALVAERTGAPIVPVWISGTSLTNHMLLHIFMPCKARVKFGKPFTLPKGIKREEALAIIREKMLELSNN